MNREQLQKEYDKTFPEYLAAKENFERLGNKIDLLLEAVMSIQNYESSSHYNFDKNKNSLEHFLESGKVTIGPKLYCRKNVFVSRFGSHCKEQHFKEEKFNYQFYNAIFLKYGIKVEERTNASGYKPYDETFIMGVNVKNMEEDEIV